MSTTRKKKPEEKVRVRNLYLCDRIWNKCVTAARGGGYGEGKTDGTAVSKFLEEIIDSE